MVCERSPQPSRQQGQGEPVGPPRIGPPPWTGVQQCREARSQGEHCRPESEAQPCRAAWPCALGDHTPSEPWPTPPGVARRPMKMDLEGLSVSVALRLCRGSWAGHTGPGGHVIKAPFSAHGAKAGKRTWKIPAGLRCASGSGSSPAALAEASASCGVSWKDDSLTSRCPWSEAIVNIIHKGGQLERPSRTRAQA